METFVQLIERAGIVPQLFGAVPNPDRQRRNIRTCRFNGTPCFSASRLCQECNATDGAPKPEDVAQHEA